MAKKIALTVGIIFIIVGILGFISNPLVGDGALFHTDHTHDAVHLITGIVILIAGMGSAQAARMTLKVVGVVYLLVAIIGFFSLGEDGTGSVLGLIGINSADNWLHVVLGVVLLALGFKGGNGDSSMNMSSPSMPSSSGGGMSGGSAM